MATASSSTRGNIVIVSIVIVVVDNVRAAKRSPIRERSPVAVGVRGWGLTGGATLQIRLHGVIEVALRDTVRAQTRGWGRRKRERGTQMLRRHVVVRCMRSGVGVGGRLEAKRRARVKAGVLSGKGPHVIRHVVWRQVRVSTWHVECRQCLWSRAVHGGDTGRVHQAGGGRVTLVGGGVEGWWVRGWQRDRGVLAGDGERVGR